MPQIRIKLFHRFGMTMIGGKIVPFARKHRAVKVKHPMRHNAVARSRGRKRDLIIRLVITQIRATNAR